MNCVNVVYLFGVLCIMVTPSFTAPANVPDDSRNELASDLPGNTDAEIFETITNQNGSQSVGGAVPPESTEVPELPDTPGTPQFFGSGVIHASGMDGSIQCKNVICPNKTETCMYRETLASDGKTSKVEVQCLGKNGNVLLAKTSQQPMDQSILNMDGFFSFPQSMNTFFDDIWKRFGF